MRCLVVLLVLAACIVGCRKSENECNADAEALAKQLDEAPHQWLFHPPKALVMRSDLPQPKLGSGATVEVSRFGVSYMGEGSMTKESLEFRLKAARSSAREDVVYGKLGAADPDLVYLLVDPEAPWERVVMVFDAAEAVGMTRQGFVFEDATKIMPPPRTPLSHVLDEADWKEVGRLLAKNTEDCESLRELLGMGVSRPDLIIPRLPMALVHCDCDVNMTALRELLWHLFVPPYNLRVIEFAPGIRDETIAFPGKTTWAEASKKFVPSLRGARLVVQ